MATLPGPTAVGVSEPGRYVSFTGRSMWDMAAVYLGLVGVTSLASFAAYGFDKRRAAVGGRRVPERTLHLMALAGGWPGAILGQRQFRHKTRKVRFLVVFWAVVLVHVAVVGAAAYALAGVARP
ncbi:MAG TPA: DUF1294 domain-containing protein [Urbifossiella sp.]|jgi:uncharacterized membrane protein YsdA (DUF1294 family)|nr:DUF1294 domain-containing protein [Urbifossiella sp.]